MIHSRIFENFLLTQMLGSLRVATYLAAGANMALLFIAGGILWVPSALPCTWITTHALLSNSSS